MTVANGLWVRYSDDEAYLENQWAEDTYVAFERENGEEGAYVSNLASMLCNLARWCDSNGLQFSEASKLAAKQYAEETEGQGRQFIPD